MFQTYKLGKLAPRHDPRTLQLANYLDFEALPSIPSTYTWGSKVKSWPMSLNDQLGDCTCAAAGHMIEAWVDNNKGSWLPKDADILRAYEAVSGYNPHTGQNDNGAVITDVLNYWRTTGIAGHHISAYAALEPRNHSHVSAAGYLFGGVDIGVALPLSAQNQRIWSVPPGGPIGNGAPGGWGGHSVSIIAVTSTLVTFVTWGMTMQMTWGFWDAYVDEAYAVLSSDWAVTGKVAPSGFNFAALQSDLSQVTH